MCVLFSPSHPICLPTKIAIMIDKRISDQPSSMKLTWRDIWRTEWLTKLNSFYCAICDTICITIMIRLCSLRFRTNSLNIFWLFGCQWPPYTRKWTKWKKNNAPWHFSSKLRIRGQIYLLKIVLWLPYTILFRL